MTILKKKTGYALGLFLLALGALLLFVVLWIWWSHEIFASQDILSDMTNSFWEEYPEISFGIGLRIVHYAISGFVFLIVGIAILLVRREKVRVTEEVAVELGCPYCKNKWQEYMSKAQLELMGYPQVRTLSRRKCSKCAKFIRPKIMSVGE